MKEQKKNKSDNDLSLSLNKDLKGICTLCMGSGRMYNTLLNMWFSDCPKCNGSGYIKQTD
jgi:DnaJ-class molecular chaperone